MKNTETERKFLVDRTAWEAAEKPAGTLYRQGYLFMDDKKTLRVRVAGDRGFITIKGRSDTLTRPEYEYPVPAEDAAELIERYAFSSIEKVRTKVMHAGHLWEVDEFLGGSSGLLLAEIELEDAEEPFEKPPWAGEEVTDDPHYYNAWLSQHPWTMWPENKKPGG